DRGETGRRAPPADGRSDPASRGRREPREERDRRDGPRIRWSPPRGTAGILRDCGHRYRERHVAGRLVPRLRSDLHDEAPRGGTRPRPPPRETHRRGPRRVDRGAIHFVEKPYEVDALRRTLRTVEEERRARILLGGTAAEDAIAWVLSDAATRGVLLAVVGPRAQPPSGATLVLRIDEESRPPDVFAANQLVQLNAAIEAHIGRVAHPLVYVADLSLLQAVHGLENMKAWLRHMNGQSPARG